MKKKTVKTKRPSWAPCYFTDSFIELVRKSVNTKCHICKKRLGTKDRSPHEPYEHGYCHSVVSESCLG